MTSLDVFPLLYNAFHTFVTTNINVPRIMRSLFLLFKPFWHSGQAERSLQGKGLRATLREWPVILES